MTGIDQSVNRLEALRKRAQQAYIYLGLTLLGMLAMAILVSMPLGICVGALCAVLHVCFFSREIDAYRASVLTERLRRELGCAETEISYVKNGGHDLTQFAEAGVMPMNNKSGMIRCLLTEKKNRYLLCDLSYVYEYGGAGRRAASLSGCYISMKMDAPVDFSLACCPAYLLPEGEVEAHYKKQGFDRVVRKDARNYLTFLKEGDAQIPEDLQKAIADFMRRAQENAVLYIRDGELCAFLPRRYLGKSEPNYKYPVTAQQLEAGVLWELGALLQLKKLCGRKRA